MILSLSNLNEREVYSPDFFPEIAEKYSSKDDEGSFYTLKQAYDLAKNESIALRHDVTNGSRTLTENDLIEIAQYNPQVGWNEYLSLKENKEKYGMTYFLNLYPELDCVKSNLDLNDVFFYSMDAKTPTIKFLEDKINRCNRYLNLGYIGQHLILKLYGTLDKYINSYRKSVFEDYVFVFEDNMGDQNIIMGIASRIGIILNPNDPTYSPSDQLYDKFIFIFHKLEKKNNSTELEEIINMNESEYYKKFLYQEQNIVSDISEAKEQYDNRLIIYVQNH